MNNGGDISYGETKEVQVQAYGSWVYKWHIREILNLQRSDQYREEIEILKNDIDNFEELYREKAQKHRVRIELAELIISTILERANGVNVKVVFKYTS